MLTFEHSGSFKNTEKFLGIMSKGEIFRALERYGQEGVAALASATPKDSGLTAAGWSYKVKKSRRQYSITWFNSHVVNGVPVAILLQYGHGTGTGGYVSGRNYINPALKPIFDKIADNVWKAVTSA
jgi:hypothetical protein